MESEIEEKFPITISQDVSRGRCVIAARDLSQGELVLRCAVVAAVPLGNRCWTCFEKARSGLLRCKRCHAVSYCSKECQIMDWRTDHRAECHPLCIEAPTDEELMTPAFLLGRALRSEFTSPSLLPATCVPCYFHSRADLNRMTIAGGSTSVAEDCGATAVAGLCERWKLLPPGCRDGLKVSAAFPVNNFSVTDDLMLATAAAVSPAGALLNHSCAPNCCVTYRLVKQSDPTIKCKLLLQEFRTLCSVPQGSELCHSYTETAQSRAKRAHALLEQYGFECACTLCTAEGEVGSRAFNNAFRLYGPLVGDDEALKEAAALLSTANNLSMAGFESSGEQRVAFVFSKPCGISSYTIEIWREQCLIERALQVLQRRARVPATHARLQEAVREYLNRALAIGDMGGALAAGLHSLAFFERAYHATPCHPMVSLQLYALGDVCVQASAEARGGVPDANRAIALGVLFPGDCDHLPDGTSTIPPLYTLACELLHGRGAEAVAVGLLRIAAEAYSQARTALTISHGSEVPLVLALVTQLSQLLPIQPTGRGSNTASLIEAAGWKSCDVCNRQWQASR